MHPPPPAHTHTHTHSDLHPCTVRALKIDKEQLDRESKLARRVSVQSYSHTHTIHIHCTEAHFLHCSSDFLFKNSISLL